MTETPTRPMSFMERIRSQMQHSALNPYGKQPLRLRERPKEVVKTNRFDKRDWQDAREAEVIDDLVSDLSLGDEHKGGERKEFPMAPYLVEGVYHLLHKSSPELHDPRHIDRELRASHRIAVEMQSNPRLVDLQEYTIGNEAMSVIAVDALGDQLREILARIPPPPPPPNRRKKGEAGGAGGASGGGGGQGDEQQDGGGGGGGGQGGDQGDQQQDPQGGDGQGDQNQQPEGGDGGGQPQGGDQGGEGSDPSSPQGGGGEDGQDGPPPPPEEIDKEEDEPDTDEDLTEDEEGEFDEDAEYEKAEADWEKQFDEMLNELDLDRLANRALEQAYKDVSEIENLRRDIGLEDGVWATMDPSERLAMVKQLQTPEMKMLADIIGRMRRFSLGVKTTRVVDVPHEAFDVELGNDIRHILKSEFALLSNPVTKLEFYRKYAEKELLVYKLRGTEEVGKGPIVLCLDKSGSMNGQPFRWGLAVAEALRRFAADDDRDMIVLIFGNNNDRTRFEFPKGQAPFEKVLAFLGTIANGGTQFDGVLTEALDDAKNAFDGEGKGKADIVFITDGYANLSQEWIDGFVAERQRVGVRVYSVYVGGAYDMRGKEGPLGLLERLSDACIPVRELTPESVQHVFQRV